MHPCPNCEPAPLAGDVFVDAWINASTSTTLADLDALAAAGRALADTWVDEPDPTAVYDPDYDRCPCCNDFVGFVVEAAPRGGVRVFVPYFHAPGVDGPVMVCWSCVSDAIAGKWPTRPRPPFARVA